MLDKDEVYIVVDIEANGPVPGLYSMLGIAAVATDGQEDIAEFYRKMLPDSDANEDPDTMEWWKNQPEAWQEVTANAEEPEKVMTDFATWVKSFTGTPVFVANPVALDYTFVTYYLQKFAGENPFRSDENINRTIDLRSSIAARFDMTISESRRANLPPKLTHGMPEHTHKALDDARGYAVLFRNMLREEKP